ncbi:SVM family protein [Candidatus Phytoplasma solani]|uniref:SVM family protein n=1 Tax=Candidatus Phytoplasma solani TaxID=69896 RepID=UPI00358F268C
MLIFRLKKQLFLLPIVLFTFLGLFLIDNNQVMAMNQNDSESSGSNPVNYNLNIETKINELKLKIQESALKKTQIDKDLNKLKKEDPERERLVKIKKN